MEGHPTILYHSNTDSFNSHQYKCVTQLIQHD